MTILPSEISQLPYLQALWVSDNRLVDLPEELGHCTKLKLLDASINVLTGLPASITGLHSLGALFLQHNRLDSLPAHIETLSGLHLEAGSIRLKTLDLSDNRLCGLKGEAKNWVDRFDPGWESQQNCTGRQ